MLETVRADPAVRRATGRIETGSRVLKVDGTVMEGRAADLRGVDPATDDSVLRQKDRIFEGGRWFDSLDAKEVVIDQGAADRLGGPGGPATVGDVIALPSPDGRRLELQIVGIVRKPGIFANALTTLYVPLGTLQDFLFPDSPGRISKIEGEFEVGADADAFLARTRVALDAADPLLRIQLTRETREQIDRNLQGMRLLSYLGGAVSMLAATFIVFSTLSMGVSERQRTLAMLRAVGAARGQVGGLVLIEGVILAVLGALVGVPLGWAFVEVLAWRFPFFFAAGVRIDPLGVAFAAGVTLLAAVGASLLPAVNAMRVDPLEAMAPQSHAPTGRPPVGLTILGLLLVSIDPLLMFGPIPAILAPFGLSQHAKEVSFYGHFVLGLPGWMLGFFLLAPLFVWTVERALARPVAALLGMPGDLLRQQLSGGGLWRAAGTGAALMVGLAVLVVMQVQGNTALNGWRLPDKFPDVFVYTTSLAGLDPAAQQAVRDQPGVLGDRAMPVAVFNPRLPESALGVAGAAVFDQTMFIGVDPDRVFDLMELEFLEGNPADATRLLKEGRHLLITDEFRKLKGYGLGDTFSLQKGVFGGRIEYAIAGVVSSPGIDVMVGTFDLGGQFAQQSAASVFGSLDDARKDFGVERARLMAVDLQPGVDKAKVVGRPEGGPGRPQPERRRRAEPQGDDRRRLPQAAARGEHGRVVGDGRRVARRDEHGAGGHPRPPLAVRHPAVGGRDALRPAAAGGRRGDLARRSRRVARPGRRPEHGRRRPPIVGPDRRLRPADVRPVGRRRPRGAGGDAHQRRRQRVAGTVGRADRAADALAGRTCGGVTLGVGQKCEHEGGREGRSDEGEEENVVAAPIYAGRCGTRRPTHLSSLLRLTFLSFPPSCSHFPRPRTQGRYRMYFDRVCGRYPGSLSRQRSTKSRAWRLRIIRNPQRRPAEVGRLAAGVRADVAALKEQGVRRHAQQDPRQRAQLDLHRREQHLHPHPRRDRRRRDQHAVHARRRADQRRVRRRHEDAQRPENHVRHRPAQAAQQVEDEELPAAQHVLDEAAEHPQPQHVAEQVPEARVQELEPEESPELQPADRLVDGEEPVPLHRPHAVEDDLPDQLGPVVHHPHPDRGGRPARRRTAAPTARRARTPRR